MPVLHAKRDGRSKLAHHYPAGSRTVRLALLMVPDSSCTRFSAISYKSSEVAPRNVCLEINSCVARSVAQTAVCGSRDTSFLFKSCQVLWYARRHKSQYSRNELMNSRQYSSLKATSLIVGIAGILAILSVLAEEISKGHSDGIWLIGGTVALAAGGLVFLLADIGEKVSGKNHRDPLDDV